MIKSWQKWYIRIRGCINEIITGDSQYRYEQILFIVNISYNQAKKMAQKIHQDLFLYSGPETAHNIAAFDSDGAMIDSCEVFSPLKIAQINTIQKGRPYIFEYLPMSVMEGMGYQFKPGIHIPGFRRWNEK
ncbi:MAG: hypothetical protein AB9903_27950 [Vulcanimicrobiota bacterium]